MKPACKTHISLFLSIFVFFISICSATYANAAEKYYYQLKIYHLKTQAQEDRLNNYLQNAYIPAMHRMGIKNIGVFKPVESDTLGRRIYVFTPFRTWGQLENTEEKLMADQQYV